jgi:F-type H+-transporting ATPase subunit epsilon
MSDGKLPSRLMLEVVTPEGLLLREEVDDVVAPGELGYFGVRPGHAPFLSTLGLGEISFGRDGQRSRLTCFWGFCEVLADRVNILAEVSERAETIDPERAESARQRAVERLKAIHGEAGYREARADYIKAVTRLGVVRGQKG